MSHGKRMLKAQERRDSMGVAADGAGDNEGSSARSSTGTYLRSDRAFDPDGTPNRPRRRQHTSQEGSTDRPVDVSPHPERDGTAKQPGAVRKRSRSRSWTPPALHVSAVTAATHGVSPQQRFLPSGLRSVQDGVASGPPTTPPPQPTSSSTSSTRATPRRRTTRNYPIERVSAALSATAPAVRAATAAEVVRKERGHLPPPLARSSAPAGETVGGVRAVLREDEEGGGHNADRAPSPGSVTTSRAQRHAMRRDEGPDGAAAAYRRPPSFPPLPATGSGSPQTATTTLSSSTSPSMHDVGPRGARLPMPSPPLRAIVSPRMAPQHLSRRNSNASQSRGFGPHSPQSTPSVSVGAADSQSQLAPQRTSPPAPLVGSSHWALPTAALTRTAEPQRVVLGADEEEDETPQDTLDGGAQVVAVREGHQLVRRGQPEFPAAPPAYGSSVAADPNDEEGREDNPVSVSGSGSGEGDFLAEVWPSPFLPVPASAAEAASAPPCRGNEGLISHRGGAPAVSAAPHSVATPPQRSPPLPTPLSSTTPHGSGTLRVSDYSGFHNRGNDCYACSVLTLLLRSQMFRTAMFSAPLSTALSRLKWTKPCHLTSGYTNGDAVFAPNRRGGKRHREASLSPTTSSADSQDDGGAERDEVTDEDCISADRHGEPLPTVHGQLADLWRQTWARERFTFRINEGTHESGEAQRGLFQRFLSRFTSKRTGENTYRFGVDLQPLARLFSDDFFTGEQEDAHEFFVALIAKLEGEAEEMEKRRLTLTAAASPGKMEQLRADSDDEQGEEPRPPPPPPPLLDEANAVKPPTSLPPVWVNELLQGKLLNIVRCRNPGCLHHIASEEPYVNLTVNLSAEESGQQRRKADDSGPSHALDGAGAAETARAEAPSISQLLSRSLQYGRLDDYVCDACGSKARQYQGACFYQKPPPMLLVQLKRFAIHMGVDASGSFAVTMIKDRGEVHVEDLLEVYSLPPCSSSLDGAVLYHHKDTNQLGEAVLRAEEGAAPGPDASPSVAADDEDVRHHKDTVGDLHLRQGDGVDERRVDAVRSVYQLRGTVLHLGRELSFGHYVSEFAVELLSPKKEHEEGCGEASAGDGAPSTSPSHGGDLLQEPVPPSPSLQDIRDRLPRLCWRLADDAVVKELDSDAVAEQRRHCDRSYLLSYEKVFEERVRVPVWKVLPVLQEGEEAEREQATSLSSHSQEAESTDGGGGDVSQAALSSSHGDPSTRVSELDNDEEVSEEGDAMDRSYSW